VTAVAVSSTTVSLTWTDASSNESEFKIYRKRSGGPWSLVVSVPANTTGYQDAGRTPGITYAYRMRAENSAGRSPYSNDSRVTMPAAP
jgi:hypothetical protein